VDHWFVRIPKSGEWSYLICGCNGSKLPVYVGPPPDVARTEEWLTVLCPQCGTSSYDTSGSSFAVVIGIGYEVVVPNLGEIEVEMAKEVVVACECNNCSAIHISWDVHLPSPFEIIGTEPWLAAIQGFSSRKIAAFVRRRTTRRSL
jgi:hypothetical protein